MDQDEAFAMWEDGANDCEIARAFSVTSGAVRSWRLRNGLASKWAPKKLKEPGQ